LSDYHRWPSDQQWPTTFLKNVEATKLAAPSFLYLPLSIKPALIRLEKNENYLNEFEKGLALASRVDNAVRPHLFSIKERMLTVSYCV